MKTVLKWLASIMRRARFTFHRSAPKTGDYLAAREHTIEQGIESLAGGTFEPPQGFGIGIDERAVEYPWLLNALPKNAGSLLDAGSTLNTPTILDRLELDRRRLVICTLAPEAECHWKRGISYVFEDLRDLSFRDGRFDAIACLSVLEHVGMDNTIHYTRDPAFRETTTRDYLRAVGELRRVLAPGGTLFITIPYGKPGDFGWFQQFGRDRLAELVESLGPGLRPIDFYRYRGKGWSKSTQQDCDDAAYHDMRAGQFRGDDLAVAARAVACLTWVKPA